MDLTNKINAAEIERLLAEGGFSRAEVELRDRVTSTNTLLKQAAESGASEGRVLIALEQTAGRGRMGRSFHSPVGGGLYISILLRPSLAAEDVLLLTPMTAVAVCRALEASGSPKTEIKWVNDIYVGGKKASGILVEGAVGRSGNIDYAVVGVGINLYPPMGGFPNGLKDTACAVFEPDQSIDPNRIVADLVLELFAFYRSLDSRKFMDEYRSRSMLLGREVTVTRGGEEYCGIAVDIDGAARLKVRLSGGEELLFDSGEARAKTLQMQV